MADDPFKSILGELATPKTALQPVAGASPSKEEQDARAQARMRVLLGQRLGVGRAASDDEVKAFLLVRKGQQKQRQMLGAILRDMFVQEGPGLDQIENYHDTRGPFKDEFQDTIEKMDAASVGPNGERLDDLYQNIQAMEAARAAAVAQAPNNAAPPSALGQNLGSTAQVTIGGPPTQVVSWVGDNDAQAMPITVLINPVNFALISSSPLTAAIRPFAFITFGNKINSMTIEVDIGRGCQLCVGGSAVTVQVGLDVPPSGELAGVKTFTLGAALSFQNTSGRSGPALRTRYVDALANAGSITIFAPPFADRVWWFGTGAAVAGNTLLKFIDAAQWSGAPSPPVAYDAKVSSSNADAVGDIQFTPIPLSSDIVGITVFNGDAQTISGKLIFELAL